MKYFWIIVLIIVVFGGVYFLTQNEAVAPEEEITEEEVAGIETLEDGTYAIDTQESVIGWTGRKPEIVGYEDSGIVSLSGGSVSVKDGVISGGLFTVDLTTITAQDVSNNFPPGNLTNHLKSEDFFNVEMYPEATFEIKNVSDNTITGDLTIKGITKKISFPAIVKNVDGDLVATADVEFNRADFDVRFGSGSFFEDLGDNIIDDMVSISLDLHALPQQMEK